MDAKIDTMLFPGSIVSALRQVLGSGEHALHEPLFKGNEWRYLKECLDTNYVSSLGPFVSKFEAALAGFTGHQFAIAVVNGTAALHVAMKLVGVCANDEVLIPTLTFVATSNAVSYCGAVPHYVDSEERSLGIDPRALRDYLGDIARMHNGVCINRLTGRIIRAITPMHVVGHPADMEELSAVAADFGLALVEDAAEALGSSIGGTHVGHFGRAAIISFNGNKTITTGGGGAIITNDRDLAKRAKHLTTTAKVPHRWEYRHDELAYNYRLPNLNAALGCAQLEQLPSFLRAKRRLHERYAGAFQTIPGVSLLSEPKGTRSSYWLQTLMLSRATEHLRDRVLEETNDAGIMTRPIWVLNNRLPAFQHCPRMSLPVAESLERRIINIPSSPHLAPMT